MTTETTTPTADETFAALVRQFVNGELIDEHTLISTGRTFQELKAVADERKAFRRRILQQAAGDPLVVEVNQACRRWHDLSRQNKEAHRAWIAAMERAEAAYAHLKDQ